MRRMGRALCLGIGYGAGAPQLEMDEANSSVRPPGTARDGLYGCQITMRTHGCGHNGPIAASMTRGALGQRRMLCLCFT